MLGEMSGQDKSGAITGSVLDMSGGQWNPRTDRSGRKERRKERERDGAREERTWLWAGQGTGWLHSDSGQHFPSPEHGQAVGVSRIRDLNTRKGSGCVYQLEGVA